MEVERFERFARQERAKRNGRQKVVESRGGKRRERFRKRKEGEQAGRKGDAMQRSCGRLKECAEGRAARSFEASPGAAQMVNVIA